jgi:hypothetical protein
MRATITLPLIALLAEELGPGYIFRAEPERVTLVCTDCPGVPMIDILLGTQTDGTEGRLRSGVTSIADLERNCRSRNDACRIKALDVAPAVGWVSHYPWGSGSDEGATAVIILDGQLLTVRVVAGQEGTPSAIIERLLPLIRARIIGQ